MKLDEVLLKYVNTEKKERTPDRLWASDIYNIIKKKVTPESFFEHEQIDLESARRIISGLAYEQMWANILSSQGIEFEYQKKYEIPIEDFTLVVTPDFEFKDRVEETKFPSRIPEVIPEWYEYQLEAEHRATNKPVYLAIFTHPFDIRHIAFEPSEERWKKIQEALIDFHQKLKVVNK